MVCKQNCWMFGSKYQKFILCYMIHVIAVHSLTRVESRRSAWVIRREFAEIRFILFVPLWDCIIAAPMPKFEASHIA